MHAAAAASFVALFGLAAALPQAASSATSSAPPATTTVGEPVARTKNFTLAIGNNPEAGLNGFVLQQRHVGAGENYLVFERPSANTGYVSYLEGSGEDLDEGHAWLLQYLPGSTGSPYGVKVPSAGKPGDLAFVEAMPGEQSEAFGVSTGASNKDQLTYYTFERDTNFYACADSVAGIDDTLFLKYGAIVAPDPVPAGCNRVEMYATYQ